MKNTLGKINQNVSIKATRTNNHGHEILYCLVSYSDGTYALFRELWNGDKFSCMKMLNISVTDFLYYLRYLKKFDKIDISYHLIANNIDMYVSSVGKGFLY